MKKIFTYILLVTAACLMFTACAEKELDIPENLIRSGEEDSRQTENLTYLEATLGDTSTKTAMSSFGGSWKTLWQSEDKIAVFFDGSSGAVDFSLERGEGQNVGVFSGNANGKVWTALYPAMDAESMNKTCINLNLPETQTYAEDSFGPDSYPMVAAPTSGTMQFKNLCSTIKVQLKGHHVIDSIRFTAHDSNVSVCGPASVDVNFTEAPSLIMKPGGFGSVTLDVGGLLIDPNEITDFYLVLPAQTYRGGFTLKIFTRTGSMTCSTTSDVTIERSKVHSLTPFYVKLDDGMEPSVALEGSGTEASPLLIRNLSDLMTMISSVNANTNIRTSEGKKKDANTAVFRLENDIDLSPVCSKNGKSWTPIGGKDSFCGVLDGNGHKLSNLYVDTDKQKAGLFGYLKGTVRNLTVSGTVTSSNRYVGMIAGCPQFSSLIENCTTYGEVTSSYNGNYSEVGGIAGGFEESGSKISGCRNYATVEGYDSIGGIVGFAFFVDIDGCINFGTIKATTYGGGVVGIGEGGLVYNCSNCGDIEGSGIIGGICGGNLTCKIANCINSGKVYAELGYIGGIFGHSSGNEDLYVQNCVNVGNILTPKSFSGNKGGIAGMTMSKVLNCYWLYDAQAKLGIKKGIDLGDEEYCFALTADQINGIETFTEPLYYNKEGIPSINSLDALNNWAADNSDEYQYWGWTFNDGDKWLSLTGKPAKSGQGDVSTVFVVTPTEVSLSYENADFEVKVVAGMGHKISSMPDWISVTGTDVAKADEITTTTYTFKAQANPDYVERSGVIVLCNDAQQCVPVTVTQMEKINEDDVWKTKNFYHRSVGFKFTATWCQYCPLMAEEWDYAKEILGDKFQIVAFHPTSSDLGFAEIDKMVSAYRISSYPTGIVDGRALVDNKASYIKPVSEETEKAYGTSSGIEFVSEINGNTINLDVNLYIHEKGDYKITALLLEDNIISGQQDVRNGWVSDFKHDNIVRLAFSEITGDKFTLSSNNSIVPFKYSGQIPSQCNPANLRILVYVERAYGTIQKMNKVQGVSYFNYTGYFVDNANTAPVGQKAEITFDDGTGIDEKYESKDYSADGKVIKLQSATVGNGIDIVITGDAFADKDQKLLETYANRAMEAFFAVEPYNSLRDRFNVWSINAVSRNDFIGGITKFSTIFGEGTRVGGDLDRILSFVRDNIPSVDLTKTTIVVLVNHAVYAGTNHISQTNETIAFVPLQTSLSEFDDVLRHEAAGHGFGKLDDEYFNVESGQAPADWISSRKAWQESGRYENVDFTDDPEIIRWKHFLNDTRYAGQVGIYQGGGTYESGVWRSTENSIMRNNYGTFNAPSREAIYKKIMRFSEGDSWTYDYETFVEFDAKGRREEAAHSYTYTKAYGAQAQKKNVPLHPPVLMERR